MSTEAKNNEGDNFSQEIWCHLACAKDVRQSMKSVLMLFMHPVFFFFSNRCLLKVSRNTVQGVEKKKML